ATGLFPHFRAGGTPRGEVRGVYENKGLRSRGSAEVRTLAVASALDRNRASVILKTATMSKNRKGRCFRRRLEEDSPTSIVGTRTGRSRKCGSESGFSCAGNSRNGTLST